MTLSAAALVDLERYPIHDPEGRRESAAAPAAAFARDGVAELPRFIRPEALERIITESESVAPDGHHSEVTNTAFLGAPPTGGDPRDPMCRPVRSSLRAIPADCIPTTHALRQLYEWGPLRDFVRLVLGVEELHPYADPLGSLNVADMGPGDELGWHFDQSDFVTSLAIRPAGSGGHFEVVTGLRSEEHDDLDAVRDVLDGRSDEITRLRFEPGTLLVFAGRWSMHRVTPVDAAPSRLVGLLSFDTRPGTDSTERLKMVRYGRCVPRELPPPTRAPSA